MVAWGAIGSVAGGLLSGAGSMASSAMSYWKQKALVAYQQRWQERMSNTAHQREVKDLRAAGLNPILSGMGGSGASFGSASASSGDVSNPISDGVATAVALRQQKNQDRLTDAQRDNYKADSYLKGNQAQVASEAFNTQIEQTNQLKANIANQTALTQAQIRNLDAQSKASLINSQANMITAGASVNSAKAAVTSSERITPSQLFGKTLSNSSKDFKHFIDNNKAYRFYRKYAPLFMFNQ